MKTSQNGINLIKSFEGCKLKAYKDIVGILTIGYGHTGKDVTDGLIISQDVANSILQSDLIPFENRLNGLVLKINQNQFDALMSFIYNLGFGSLLKSTMLIKIKENPNNPTIPGEFMKWDLAGGKVVKGLQVRRQKEAELYTKNIL